MNFDNDNELITALMNKDNKAFEYMYKQHFGGVKSIVLKNGGSDSDVYDHFHDVVIKLIENLSKGLFRKESKLSTYFLSMAKFMWYDKKKIVLRENKLKESLRAHNLSYEEISNEARVDKHKIIYTGMNKLSEECRKIIDQYYFSKIKLKKIADNMGYTYDYARIKKTRCLKKLRAILGTDLKLR